MNNTKLEKRVREIAEAVLTKQKAWLECSGKVCDSKK